MNTTLDLIRQPIEPELSRLNTLFEKTMSQSDGLLGKIFQSISQRRGKLMRPILLLLVAKEWGRVGEPAYYSALTLELLHNASLVHDDIVDESDQRRGQPSVRAMFGNKAAVLSGDYLLSTALECASLSQSIEIVRNISLLGKQLSEGEILQLTNTQQHDLSEETYYRVIQLKTASLFATAARLGAITAAQSPQKIEEMDRLGNLIGLMFQIRDDIFDYFDNNVGKPTGNDMLEGKLTLPALFALKSTKDKTMHHLSQRVKDLSATKEEIATLIRFTKESGGIDYAQQQIQQLAAQAQKIVEGFKTPSIRQSLSAYINFLCSREK